MKTFFQIYEFYTHSATYSKKEKSVCFKSTLIRKLPKWILYHVNARLAQTLHVDRMRMSISEYISYLHTSLKFNILSVFYLLILPLRFRQPFFWIFFKSLKKPVRLSQQ